MKGLRVERERRVGYVRPQRTGAAGRTSTRRHWRKRRPEGCRREESIGRGIRHSLRGRLITSITERTERKGTSVSSVFSCLTTILFLYSVFCPQTPDLRVPIRLNASWWPRETLQFCTRCAEGRILGTKNEDHAWRPSGHFRPCTPLAGGAPGKVAVTKRRRI